MNTGKCRPDWTQDGPLTRWEWAQVLWYRQAVLDGHPSLYRPGALDEVEMLGILRAMGEQKGITTRRGNLDRLAVEAAAKPKLPRPPGVPDDHPHVLDGTYA